MLNFQNSKYVEFYFSNKFQFKDCKNFKRRKRSQDCLATAFFGFALTMVSLSSNRIQVLM